MNVYDTANRLAQELKASEEYKNFKMAKQAISLNSDLKNKIDEFEKARYEAQIMAMQTGKNDEEKISKIQQMYADLLENTEAKNFIEAETKFNILFADVNKIIGEAVVDVMN